MTFQLVPLDPVLTGVPARMTDGDGPIVGVSEPDRNGWIYRNGAGEFLSVDTTELVPASVNDSAVVVGTVGPRDSGRAFLFHNGMTDLQAKLGNDFGRARDISNTGVVVGTAGPNARAFIAYRFDTASGALTHIPFPAGLSGDYTGSEAVAVTADGQLAAGIVHKDFGESPRGFVYDHTTGLTTDLGPSFLPRAINNARVLAGADLHTGQGVSFDLATQTFQRRGNLLIEGMNDHGDVVGSMTGGAFSSIACLSRPGQPLIDLNSLLPAGSGVALTTATDVNAEGSIVGLAIAVDPATGQPAVDPASGQSRSKPFLMKVTG